MSDQAPSSPVAGDAMRPAPSTAGGMLRAAREAAGMTIDTVAQQLKLAPRQVTALEEGDFAGLPGRTFVRGFLRNYARLVHVDPERVLAALSAGDSHEPDSPALHPTAPTMGELPTSDHARPGWTRWAIPLTLIAVVATAAIYEFARGPGEPRRPAVPTPAASEPEPPPAAKAPAAGGAETSPPAPPSTPLSNPFSAAPATVAPAGPAAGAAAPGGAEATLVLAFRDSSWAEVKDAGGRLLLSQMVGGGQTRSVTGVPPFDVVIGNAAEASLTFRGQPVDLAPYTRQNVAHVVLQ